MDDIGRWTRAELARLAKSAVGEEGTPGFYAVTGSRIYGFSSDDSDVDLRGFHCADAVGYLRLDQPGEQVTVTHSGPSSRRDATEVDLVSYELRKFTALLSETNFNVLEVVFDGLVVTDEHPRELDALRALVEDALPLDVPAHYMGMAKHQYDRSRAATGDANRPTAKEYLYGLRGMLAAHYVREARTIESDVRVLSEAVLGDTEVVDALVAAKREASIDAVDGYLAADAERLMGSLFDETVLSSRVDKSDYRAALDEWMLGVRGVDWETG